MTFRPPLIAPRQEPKRVPEFQQSNLLETTLLSKDALPFRQRDWPNPRGPEFPVELRTWTAAYKWGLLGKDFFPNRQSDWPNPSLGYPFPVENRTFLNPLEQQLIGKDLFFGGAGKAPVYDYPNPRGPARGNPSFEQGLNLALTQVVAPTPFTQLDWQNPKGAGFPSILRTWTESYKLVLIGQDALPNRQSDWLNPKGPTSDKSAYQQGPNLALTQVVSPAPFSQLDWQNPRGAEYPSILRTWLENYKLGLIGQDALPNRQQDWPTPRGLRLDNRAYEQGLNLSLTVVQVVPSPFAQLDWQNPLSALRPAVIEVTQNLAVTTTPTPTPVVPTVVTGGAGGLITFLAYSPKQAVSEKVRLYLALKSKKKRLKTVERKIRAAEKVVVTAKAVQEPPQGILANLHLLRERRSELRRDIEVVAVNLQAMRDFLESLEFPDDDEDDIEVLILQ